MSKRGVALSTNRAQRLCLTTRHVGAKPEKAGRASRERHSLIARVLGLRLGGGWFVRIDVECNPRR
jgi:hypothetical protein